MDCAGHLLIEENLVHWSQNAADHSDDEFAELAGPAVDMEDDFDDFATGHGLR